MYFPVILYSFAVCSSKGMRDNLHHFSSTSSPLNSTAWKCIPRINPSSPACISCPTQSFNNSSDTFRHSFSSFISNYVHWWSTPLKICADNIIARITARTMLKAKYSKVFTVAWRFFWVILLAFHFRYSIQARCSVPYAISIRTAQPADVFSHPASVFVLLPQHSICSSPSSHQCM